MRHSSRHKHLKHLHRAAHIRRMCYFRTVKLNDINNSLSQVTENQVTPLEIKASDNLYTK